MTYEETRKAIRKAIDNYTNNTQAVAQMLLDVVTREITCSQFDKFFEKLIIKVFHYRDHKTYEDIIINNSSLSPVKSPNSDTSKTLYQKSLDSIQEGIGDITAMMYDDEDKTVQIKAIADMTDAIAADTSTYVIVGLCRELLSGVVDDIDEKEVCDILDSLTPTYELPVSSIAIKNEIASTTQAGMCDSLSRMTRAISQSLNIENFSMFYALTQKKLMERLDKEGENTDVF